MQKLWPSCQAWSIPLPISLVLSFDHLKRLDKNKWMKHPKSVFGRGVCCPPLHTNQHDACKAAEVPFLLPPTAILGNRVSQAQKKQNILTWEIRSP